MGNTWQNRLRHLVIKNKTWSPCICIQGGGARGAWEAGILAEFLNDSKTFPSSMWGTSAGAINALWATKLTQEDSPDRLLLLWLSLANRVRISAGVSLLFIGMLVILMIKGAISSDRIASILFDCVPILFLFLFSIYILVRTRSIVRLPGLLPVKIAAKLIPTIIGKASFSTYFCSADVNLKRSPGIWDFDTLGIFKMKPNSDCTIRILSDEIFPTMEVIMASAAVPVLCKPYLANTSLLLDGGLEANLPIGFLKSNGPLGGGCAICIIPHMLEKMDPKHHVDYRVLRFLRDIRDSQAEARKDMEKKSSGIFPPHVFTSIIVMTPPRNLSASSFCGFFFPSQMKRDFRSGRSEGKLLLKALSEFEKGDDQALDQWLLENQEIKEIEELPNSHWWTPWVNTGWID